MILQTKRLILRKWTENDAESLFEYAKDEDVGPIAGWSSHKNIEESRSVIQNVFCGSECYAICIKPESGTNRSYKTLYAEDSLQENNLQLKPVGAIELILNGKTDKTSCDDECELGFWIGKPFWNKGYITEAAKEIIRHAFEDLKMSSIWCAYYEGNEASKRVQEKCGFKFSHTIENSPVPLLKEERTCHINILTNT